MKRGFYPPRPEQAVCRLCDRLFAYFRTTRPRRLCSPCVEIQQRLAVVLSNDLQRQMRLEARQNAILCHEVTS